MSKVKVTYEYHSGYVSPGSLCFYRCCSLSTGSPPLPPPLSSLSRPKIVQLKLHEQPVDTSICHHQPLRFVLKFFLLQNNL